MYLYRYRICRSGGRVKILIGKNYKEVVFVDEFLENGFLETFYEWCDFNGIDIEFNEDGA